jgi:large subunit ribosomal protein L19
MAAELKRPDFGPGDLIELKLSVPENKRRVTVFKGICIARRNRSVRTSFTLRNLFGASGGVERTFPL